MTVTRQERIEELYRAALACDERERSAFLVQVCGADKALRREVASLLVVERRQIGPYRVVSLLGAGGMGEVYRAHDPQLGRDVAIKVLPPAFSADPERLARFEREARLLAAINHPNIATIYGVEQTDEGRALVLELVEGPTLAEHLEAGPLPFDEALHIARQIAEALEAAHEKGILHRDLKPANIKLTTDGRVKVLDFGLAKLLDADVAGTGRPMQRPHLMNLPTITTPAVTEAGVILGTAAYMSPEQAKGQPVDKRSDIWAFGVVLYEMLAGTRLFEAETTTETLAAVIQREPRWDKIPRKAQPLLRRCLEKDSKKRLRDVGDAMAWIEQAPTAVEATFRERIPLTRRRWLLAALTLTAVVSAAMVVVRWPPWLAQRNVVPVRFEVAESEKMRLFLGAAMAVSPDGHWMVFPAIGEDGVGRYWLRSLDTVEARPLVGTERARIPVAWSWDSRFVFLTITNKLQRVDLLGGPLQTLADLPGGSVLNGATSNKDGVIVFGVANIQAPLFRVASGGSIVPVTARAPDESNHTWPQFLPDGHHFLYVRGSSDPNVRGVYVGSIDVKSDQQSPNRLLATDRQAYYAASPNGGSGHLIFLRGTTLMAQPFDPVRMVLSGEPAPIADDVDSYPAAYYGLFSVSDTGTLVYRKGIGSQLILTAFDQHGNRTGTIGDASDPSINGAVSPDGLRVAMTRNVSGSQDIWVVDIGRNASTQFTFGGGAGGAPVWSPDGKSIVFASYRSGRANLYIKPTDGSSEERLLTDQPGVPTSWSKDGRFLLFTNNSSNRGADIWVLRDPGRGSGPAQATPVLATPFVERSAHFSPDGKWIAYTSNESGTDEVYVRPFSPDATGNAASAKWLVSKGSAVNPRWRADGKQLFYGDLNGVDIMAVDIDTRQGFNAGVPRRLFSAPSSFGIAGGSTWDVTPDNHFLLVGPPDPGGPARFNVVVNWQAELRK